MPPPTQPYYHHLPSPIATYVVGLVFTTTNLEISVMNPNHEKVLANIEARGFEKAYGFTAVEVYKSWDCLAESTPKEVHEFFSWAANLGLDARKFVGHVHCQMNQGKQAQLVKFVTSKGGIRALVKSGAIADIIQHGVVYEGDNYELRPAHVFHDKIVDPIENKPVVLAYMTVATHAGHRVIYTLTGAQIMKRRPPKPSQYSGWVQWPHEMYMKTIALHVFKQRQPFMDAKYAAKAAAMVQDSEDIDNLADNLGEWEDGDDLAAQEHPDDQAHPYQPAHPDGQMHPDDIVF